MRAVPSQPPLTGTTEMFAVIGSFPLLIAVKEGILLTPNSGKPMFGFEFVHLKFIPVGVPVKKVAGIMSPSFSVVSALTTTVGTVLTVTVIVNGFAHCPALGVNV